MTRRCAIAALALLSTLTACSAWKQATSSTASSVASPASDAPAVSKAPEPHAGQQKVALACSGRVEGRTETVEVGAAADGVVAAVYVVEGQTVRRGALLAELACADLAASLEQAAALEESARQSRLRLVRGARDEERRAAEQRTAAARAVLVEAQAALQRAQALAAKAALPPAELDQAQRNRDLAQARVNTAAREEDLAKAAALPEDLARADSEIRAAGLQHRVLGERLAKCRVAAPIDGTILRVLLKPGESYSTLTSRGLFQMADLTERRVRAEVDERDVGSVRIGTRAVVFPEARRERTFAGTVQSIYKVMGRRRTLTGDPAEKTDHDVLETIVLLDRAAIDLPVGLRVVVQFPE